MTEAYDRYVFDLDGTLVDVEESYVREVVGRVGDRIGYEFSAAQADRLWHGLGGQRNAQLREWGLDAERFWEAFHEVECAEARADATFLYEDAEMVGSIDAPTVLVTHCQQYLADPVLDALDIREWFDAVVCCTPETGWKPDPGPVEAALSAAGADGGAGVLVGDSPQDIGAAWNAGLDGAHVERHDPDVRGICVAGDYRLDRVDELVRSSGPTSDGEPARS